MSIDAHVGGVALRRVAERRAGRVRVLPRHTAKGQRVAAVGGDVDLHGDVVEAEQTDRVGARRRVDADLDQTQDAVALLAEAEFFGRGDHAVRDVTVGLARGDREGAGQDGSRKGDHDLVAGEEVARSAHDPAHAVADVDLAPADGLAVLLRLLDELQHLADDDRAGELEPVNVLLFEADRDERREDVVGRGLGRDVDILTQP